MNPAGACCKMTKNLRKHKTQPRVWGWGGQKDLKAAKLGRKLLLDGGSCNITTSTGGNPTKELNKKRNTFQLPRLLC